MYIDKSKRGMQLEVSPTEFLSLSEWM
jgi:hypothetical protein